MSFHSLASSWMPAIPARRTHFLVRLFRQFRQEIRMRRAIRAVHSLDERTLVDIGLMSGSIEDAVRRGRRR